MCVGTTLRSVYTKPSEAWDRKKTKTRPTQNITTCDMPNTTTYLWTQAHKKNTTTCRAAKRLKKHGPESRNCRYTKHFTPSQNTYHSQYVIIGTLEAAGGCTLHAKSRTTPGRRTSATHHSFVTQSVPQYLPQKKKNKVADC